MWRFIYSYLFIPLIYLYFRLRSLADEKVREGFKGRKGVFESLKRQLEGARDLPKTVWIHFTSVGEFEQAKPIIEGLKDEARIVLTYFSPSVRGSVERYPHKDAHIYLPLDTRRNAKRLFEIIKPDLLIFSKFDIWPNLVWEASGRGVPVVLIAGTLHAGSKRISGLGRPFFKAVHRHISMHCAISEGDAERFKALCGDPNRVAVTGDTRFDQVYRRAMAVGEGPIIPCQQTIKRPVLVAGSTYPESERVLIDAYKRIERLKGEHPFTLILVPHEPTPDRIAGIEELLRGEGLRFAKLSGIKEGMDLSGCEVVVIDAVGLLAALYKLGDIAFVGGSFRGSVHNVMEPAAMVKPILFGPYVQNSYEAMVMRNVGGAVQVRGASELADAIVSLLEDPRRRREMGERARKVVLDNLGAADKTLGYVRKLLGVMGHA